MSINFNLSSNFIFGSGADGALDVNGGPGALTTDANHTTVLVRNGGILTTHGYKLFATKKITIMDTSRVNCNGVPAVVQTGGNGGNHSGGTYFGASGNGGNGVTGATSPGSPGGPGAFTNTSIGGSGGVGGDGGAQDGGTGNLQFAPSIQYKEIINLIIGGMYDTETTAWSTFRGGGGGGGGGKTDLGGGGTSGGGGGAGGVIFIAAPIIQMDSGSQINANGGRGADIVPSVSSLMGGGGGGGGGAIVLIYHQFIDNSLGDYNTTGGGGGDGTTGANFGGLGGLGGKKILVDLTAGTVTEFIGANGAHGINN